MRITQILTGFLIASVSCANAMAGDLEDGIAAYDRQDYATAIRLLRPLADQGKAAAQTFIGIMYNNGKGVQRDYAEAMKWYQKAADQGYARPQYDIGLVYENGEGVQRDYAEAMK
jgi:TPR repeat protein